MREGRQIAHGLGVVALQPFDLQFAAAEQRAAVGDDEQAHALALGVDVGGGAAPSRRGIAGGAQARQQVGLGVGPARVAKRRAGRQRPALAQRGDGGLRKRVATGGGAFEVALDLDVDAADRGARAGLEFDPHAVTVARDLGLGIEVALGLRKFTRLCRRGVDQAAPLGGIERVAAGQFGDAGQIQVRLQQRLERARCDHLDADHRRWRRRRRLGAAADGSGTDAQPPAISARTASAVAPRARIICSAAASRLRGRRA